MAPTIKSNRELDIMREAGRIAAGALKRMGERVAPGVSTLELDQVAEEYIHSFGATCEFNGYGPSVGGLVYAQIDHAEDRLRFAGMSLTGGLTTSGSGVLGGSAEISLFGCELKHEGIAGGSANQMLNSIRSWSRTGKTLAAVDTNDLAGDHTENIV